MSFQTPFFAARPRLSAAGRNLAQLSMALVFLSACSHGEKVTSADSAAGDEQSGDSAVTADAPLDAALTDISGDARTGGPEAIAADSDAAGGPDAQAEIVADMGPDVPLDSTQGSDSEPANDSEAIDVAQDVPAEDAPVSDVGGDVPAEDAPLSDVGGDVEPEVIAPCVDTDPDPCVGAVSDGTGGCQPLALTGVPCDDADPCTGPDSCLNGACKAGLPLCDCKSDADCAALEDKNLCNGTLVCDLSELPYSCVLDPDTVIQCPEASGPDASCFTPDCEPATGKCTLLPANTGKPCPDGDACSVGDFCTPDGCKSYFDAACDAGWPGVSATCDNVLGCLFDMPLCGNGKLDSGESCDEGAPKPGSLCAADCQPTDVKIDLPYEATDMDVAYDGSLAVASRDYQVGPRVQCFGPDRVAKGEPKLWMTQSNWNAKEGDNPRVVVSGSGKVALVGWRHYTVETVAQSRRVAVRVVKEDCTFASEPIQVSPDYVDEWWDMDIDDAGWSAVAWMGATGHPQLRFFSPAGVEELKAPTLDGGSCSLGIHTALSSIGNGGIVTCQDHSNGIWAWVFDASGGLAANGIEVPGALGHSSWYDSHTVLASAGGQFLVVWAEAALNKVHYVLLGPDGGLVHKGVLFDIVNPTPFCYDMYRWYNNKNSFVNGRFVVPFVNQGDCFAKDHQGLAIIPVDAPASPSILSIPQKLQTLVFDARGGTYVLDGGWDVLIDSVTMPL